MNQNSNEIDHNQLKNSFSDLKINKIEPSKEIREAENQNPMIELSKKEKNSKNWNAETVTYGEYFEALSPWSDIIEMDYEYLYLHREAFNESYFKMLPFKYIPGLLLWMNRTCKIFYFNTIYYAYFVCLQTLK